MRENVIAASLLLAACLPGCTVAGSALTDPSGVAGTAAGLVGIPAATSTALVAAQITGISAIAAQLQMLKAQLDGVALPTLPPISPVPSPIQPSPSPSPTPTPVTPAPIPAPAPVPTVP